MLKQLWVVIKSRAKSDLGLQLLGIYLLFVVPIFILTLSFFASASQRLREDFAAADLSLARTIALETNSTLVRAAEVVEAYAQMPEVIEADRAGMARAFAVGVTTHPDIHLFYRLSDQGVMLYHYPTGPDSTVGQDFSWRPYFQTARNTPGPIYSKGRISRTTGRPVVTSVMPVTKEGHFAGVVAANIELQHLTEIIKQISLEPSNDRATKILIVDNTGQLIAHAESDSLLQNVSDALPGIEAIFSGQEGWTIARDSTGTEWLYSYTSVPVAGWEVIVQRPTWAAFASLTNLENRLGQTLAFFGFGALIFWLLMIHWVMVPLEMLTDYGQKVGQKKESTDRKEKITRSLAQREDQIGHLTNTLLQADRDIHQRLKELTILNETSAAVVSILDLPVVLSRILEQLQYLLDIKICAILALDESQNSLHIQASRGLSKRYTEYLSRSPAHPGITMRALRSGQPLQVNDLRQNGEFDTLAPGAQVEGLRSVLVIPLHTVHAPPSALSVYKTEPYDFSEREVKLLTSFANHAAMAIENATLYAQSDARLREQTHRLEALIQSLEDGLILEDLQGNVLYANRAISELTNLSDRQIRGAPIAYLFEQLLSRTIDQEKIQAAVEASLKGEAQPEALITLSEPGGVRYLRLRIFTVTDSAGNTIGRGQILRDITKRHELDRMKSSLISTVSHELRTPLAAIKGYATTLLAEDVAWEVQEQREFLNIISVEVDRLSELVNNLLDMSRIEAGNLPLSLVLCDLRELTQQAVQRVRPQPGARLQIDLPPDLPPVSADPHRIQAVLRNLIENAIKYSQDDSPICVSAESQPGQIVVRVQDYGSGIPVEHSQRIFESFYRIDSGLVRRTSGAGLGLAICQGFVQAHGGKIWLEPKGDGTCIAFSLPVHNS